MRLGKTGRRRRSRIALAMGLSLLTLGAFSALGGSAGADTVTFPNVPCRTNIGVGATQTFTLTVGGPTSLADGSPFSVSFGGSNLALQSSFGGLYSVTAYTNISFSYAVVGATIVSGSVVQDPPGAFINGVPTVQTGTITSPTQVQFTVPGPIPPGVLITPSWTAQLLPDPTATNITINAVQFTMTADVIPTRLISFTCSMPATPILSVVTAVTTTTTEATTTTQSTTTTESTTTTSTTVPDCRPGWGYGDQNHCHSGPPGHGS